MVTVRSFLLRKVVVLVAGGALTAPLAAKPYVPADDSQVLAHLSAGTHHADVTVRRLSAGRLDVAVPLAHFYIDQARSTADLRYLGYAEAVLAPWVSGPTPQPAALVLQATLQQSRHEYTAALATLDRSLAIAAHDPQAWLTRATVLRVLGRYPEARAACTELQRQVAAPIGEMCRQSIDGLAGHLDDAYRTLSDLSVQGMTATERAWRASELGEMAARLGRDAEAERWFLQVLALNPRDFYARAAYADLLLGSRRNAEVLRLLAGQDGIEPLLLRLAIAQQRLHDPGQGRSRETLQAAFAAESQRGAMVHGREQARFLLEVMHEPRQALAAALANWAIQREPDDALVLVAAATAAGVPAAAQPALDFVRTQGLHDVRLQPAAAVRS